MEQYIKKSALVAEIEEMYNGEIDTYTRNILDRLKSNIDTLEVKEVGIWHKQSEEDIYYSFGDWNMHSYICLMKDGTKQEFKGIQDESYDGSINRYLDCVNDSYDYTLDDILYWIEIPN